MCGRLGHERQVEVWIVGGVEEDLPQHGTPRAQRLRRSAARWEDIGKVMKRPDPISLQSSAQFKANT